jgi:hypothetical protein
VEKWSKTLSTTAGEICVTINEFVLSLVCDDGEEGVDEERAMLV